MNNDAFWNRIDRYLAGEATPDEAAELEQWVREDPARREFITALRESVSSRKTSSWTVDAAWQQARLRMGPTAVVGASKPAARRPAVRPATWLKAAAVLALVFGSLAIWRLTARIGPITNDVALVTVTLAGQRDTVHLPDGSTVLLAPGSRLETQFTNRTRAVRLTGEAFFDVAGDTGRPFRVETGRAVTEVLGTEFNVRALSDTSNVIVAVREGRVSLRAQDSRSGIVLDAGAVGLATPDSTVLLSADAGKYLSWLTGHLEFENASLSDVAAELTRWFATDVRLTDASLAARRVTGRFTTGSIEEVLDALALAANVRVDRDSTGWVLRVL